MNISIFPKPIPFLFFFFFNNFFCIFYFFLFWFLFWYFFCSIILFRKWSSLFLFYFNRNRWLFFSFWMVFKHELLYFFFWIHFTLFLLTFWLYCLTRRILKRLFRWKFSSKTKIRRSIKCSFFTFFLKLINTKFKISTSIFKRNDFNSFENFFLFSPKVGF